MLILMANRLDGQPVSARGRLPGRAAPPAGTVAAVRASVRGTVLDAETDRPIGAALVSLRAEAPGADQERPRCVSSSPDDRAATVVRTDAAGAYLFDGLSVGRYTLCVRAVGYVPRVLRVGVEAASSTRVHVGLPPLATVLAPVRVTRVPAATFRAVSGGGSAAATAAVLERLRQDRYLTSDARILTRDDVVLAAGLGEMDVLRAVQQLPGVAARDDYTAAPWTRGAPGSQTTVTFDGLPLLGPYHGAGALSAVNAEAIGDVAFHPGVAPAELGGGAATLTLRTRRPTTPGLGGALGLSTIAASATVDGATRGGRAAGTLSVRRSHLDLTNHLATRLGADSDERLPYAFADVVARGDLAIGGWRLEASALAARDHLWAPIAGIVDGGTGAWDSQAGRLTIVREVPGGTLRAGAGVSMSHTALLAPSGVHLEPAGLPQDSSLYALRETVFRPQPIDSRARVRLATLSWHADESADAGAPRSAAGIVVATWQTRFATEGPWPHSAQFIDTVAVQSAATVTTLWADRVWRPAPTLTARTGARLELGAAPRNAPRVRLAPRLGIRYAPSAATSISLAAGGTYQHAQTLAPPGPGRNAIAMTDALWVVSGPNVPVLAVRTATAGAEQWFGRTLLASTTLYWRDDLGVLVPDPREGYLVDRPLAVEGRSRSAGVETSLRAFSPRWTGALSYSSGRSRTTAYGLRFASPSGRPHVVRAHTAVRARRSPGGGPNVRVAVAWEYASGAPFTRYYGSVARCDELQRCRWEPPPRIGPPSEGRGRPAHRLDASLDATWATRAVRVEGYAQVRNVTRAGNDAAYLATVGRCPAGAEASGTCQPELFPDTIEDTRLPPMRGWLSIGVRLTPRRAP